MIKNERQQKYILTEKKIGIFRLGEQCKQKKLQHVQTNLFSNTRHFLLLKKEFIESKGLEDVCVIDKWLTLQDFHSWHRGKKTLQQHLYHGIKILRNFYLQKVNYDINLAIEIRNIDFKVSWLSRRIGSVIKEAVVS